MQAWNQESEMRNLVSVRWCEITAFLLVLLTLVEWNYTIVQPSGPATRLRLMMPGSNCSLPFYYVNAYNVN